MPCSEFKSLQDLMEEWLARQKEYKAKEKKFFKEKHPVESGICFGHMVAIGECLEDLVSLIGLLQRQARDAYEVLLSTRMKYRSDVSSRDESLYESDSFGKRDEPPHRFLPHANREE